MELFQHPSKCRTVILQEMLTRCLLSNLMRLQSKLFILKKKRGGGGGKEFRGSDKILKVCTSRISISHSSRKRKDVYFNQNDVCLAGKNPTDAKCLNIFIYSVLCNRRPLKIPFAQTPLPQINNRQNKSSRLPCRNGPSIA